MHPVALYCTVALGALLFLPSLAASVFRIWGGVNSSRAPERNAMLHKVIRERASMTEFAVILAVPFLYFGGVGGPDSCSI